jgi:hypothetical protein
VPAKVEDVGLLVWLVVLDAVGKAVFDGSTVFDGATDLGLLFTPAGTQVEIAVLVGLPFTVVVVSHGSGTQLAPVVALATGGLLVGIHTYVEVANGVGLSGNTVGD